MPVAQNTPRIPRGIHHAFTKWKTRMLTREAAPTATTDSRIEIGIKVTMLGHLKCLPNQPASDRIKSAYLGRGDRVRRNRTGGKRHPGPLDSISYAGGRVVALPGSELTSTTRSRSHSHSSRGRPPQ